MKRPLRLLLVEDSASDAALIVRLLEKALYAVHAERVEDAGGMREALARAVWDAVVADYSLPQFDAPAALDVLQQTGMDIPFIVVSGTIGEKNAVDMMGAGAHDYLMKDNLARLAPAVAREVAEAQKRGKARRVAQALEEAHQLNQQIIASAQEGVVVLDCNLKHLVWNPYMERLTGLPAADVLGQTVADIFPGYRQAGLHQAFTLTLTGENVPPLDIPFDIPQTGRAGWTSNTFAPLRNAAGEITGLITTVRDITEHRRTEETLRLSEEQYRTAGNSFDYGVWSADTNGQYRYASHSFLELLGTTLEELRVAGLSRWMLPEDAQAMQEHWAECRRAGTPWSGELRLRGADGKIHTTMSCAKPVRGQDGAILFWTGVNFDISQRKTAEEQAALFSRLLDDSLSEIHVFDAASFRFLHVNRGGLKNSGYSMDELAQMTPLDVDPTLTPEALAKQVAPLRSGEKEMLLFHTEQRRKDGSCYPVEIRLQYFAHAERPVFVAIIFDITERRRMEEQVRQSQKMDAVGRLAGGVAHDFNNVTQAILGFSDLLLEDMDATDARRPDVVEIRKAAQRAASLTSQLLAFSRKQVIMPAVLNLNSTVANTQKMLQRLIGEHIRIETRLDPASAQVMADPGQMDQVIMNLAVNARDAMPDGGVLTIGTDNVILDAQAASLIPEARPGEFVCLTVSDNGTGMSREALAHLFEPFFTTKAEGHGTGLGLSVIFGIIKQHNGWINVDSQEGRGTVFRLYLPACCPDDAGGDGGGE